VILDASAVLAIVFGEPGFEIFAHRIAEAPSCSISAATLVEITMVAESRGGDQAIRQSEGIFRGAKVSVESVTEEQAYVACRAYSNFGKGRHPAGLNFGDCFSCALAKVTGEALLFKGDHFRKTDVRPAIL
jgi:ribonuclease VapC